MLNPRLAPYSPLVGEWQTAVSHVQFPGETFHGNATIRWLDGGAFLQFYSMVEAEGFPAGSFIIGSDDTLDTFSALYFDERGVSRIYQSSMEDNEFKLWRNAPGFSQRATCTLSDDHNTMHVVWEVCRDDVTWALDLETTYTRVE